VHESQESAQEPWLPTWYRVPLPPDGKRAARVSLEIGGMIANVAILDPRIGPRVVGARGERPWGSAAPDIVVFLADTFRADNLATYGGTAGVTPNLDALATESLCFTRAWSSSSWTLPSHATLFTGFLPFQVDATGETRLLAESLVTVVEMLAHSGYRTAALTDGGFVSGQFGLDQGFGVFSERTRLLPDKLEEARRFLEADDGRPVFLFVQTYRTHWPYRTDRQTMAEHGERLGIRGEPEDIVMDALAEAREQDGTRPRHLADLTGLHPSPHMLALARQLEAHYLGGVAGLDREFQGFLELLRESAVLDAGYLVFTSDHGEAFLEHGGFFHSQQPFEEQTRIPLLVHGDSVAPRRIDHAVSLLDLAPTLADMAGLEPLGSWSGRSLLDSVPGRPVLSFRARADADDGYVVLEGDRKVMCLREPEWEGERVLAAYDLASDPAEREDVMSAGAAWPHALLQRNASLIELALDPIVEGGSAELDPERAAELKALGY
jgi:arylsulfatase